MEKFRVTFEMINGQNHFYEVESTTEKVYELLNNSPDGWIQLKESGETHYIKADSIARARVISESDYNKIEQQKQEENFKALNNYGF
ncbi:hypothetical protein F9U64_19050 [Gracilibacillus oryzae]|uniref:Uncharacterized protein n=1 Tax=Gracilibacillus oryzae TaxID=1672701 RepID=A0A7C8GQX2_9BACI|nr:hypothetical protein [Gracilibacillus oryzae]KAB8126919.1 hypothetical protein F9U64_19050 [Gracilibacillus oryzae]